MLKWERIERREIERVGGVRHADSGKGTHSLADGHDDTFVYEIKSSDSAVTINETMLKKVRSKARLGCRDWCIIIVIGGSQRYTSVSLETAKVFDFAIPEKHKECKSIRVGFNFNSEFNYKIGDFEFIVRRDDDD